VWDRRGGEGGERKEKMVKEIRGSVKGGNGGWGRRDNVG